MERARIEAAAMGAKRYQSVLPCKHHGDVARTTRAAACVICRDELQRNYQRKVRAELQGAEDELNRNRTADKLAALERERCEFLVRSGVDSAP